MLKIPDALMRELNIQEGDEVNIVEMECGKGIKIKKQ